MNEYTVDLDEWIKRFPLESVPREFWYPGGVASPIDLAIIEQVRRHAARLGDLGPSVPVDILMFATGEPDHRHVTKIGGLPYRPRGLPWPKREDGVPMTFLLQFGFADSKEYMGELPGDVLLVFSRDEDMYTGDPPCFRFEWQPGGLKDLVPPNEVPAPTWVFPVCFGVRCRTVDFLDEALVSQRSRQFTGRAECNEAVERQLLRSVARLAGTKIGGLAYWPWPGEDGDVGDKYGRFLCSLRDVGPWTRDAFPWLARQYSIEPDSSISAPEEILMWRDGSHINFFLDIDGVVRWDVQF